MAVAVELIDFISGREKLESDILDFIIASADRYIDPTIPLPEGGDKLTFDALIYKEGPDGSREIIGGRSVVKSTLFTGISFYDIDAGTLEANSTGATMTFRGKTDVVPLSGAEALARARQVFGS
jgi:hypothetical protein